MGVACEESRGTNVCKVEFKRVAYGMSHPEGISRQVGVTTSRTISLSSVSKLVLIYHTKRML